MRCDACYHTSGLGHEYQQRYKSFPIQELDTVRLAAHPGRPLGVEAGGIPSLVGSISNPPCVPKGVREFIFLKTNQANWPDRRCPPFELSEILAGDRTRGV